MRSSLLSSSKTALAVAVCAAVGCSGAIAPTSMGDEDDGPVDDGPAGSGGGGRAGSGGGAGSGGAGGGDVELPAFAPAPGRLRLLTTLQLENSIRDLIGVAELPEVEPDTALAGFVSVGAGVVSVSPVGIERYDVAARQAARAAFATTAARDRLVGCSPKSAADSACATTFLRGFLRRAFRGPVGNDVVDRYVKAAVTVATDRQDFHAGLEHAVAAALSSPRFLYRVETGAEAAPGKPWRRYSSIEMASRLSYLLWNTTPDESLLAAGESGALAEMDGLRAQVARLVASPRARDGLVNFVDEWFSASHIETIAKQFPELTPALRASMHREMLALFEDVALTRKVDALEAFTTHRTFLDAGLASFYGVAPPAGGAMTAVTLPESGPRAGLLGTGAFLAMWGKQHETSPTLRGKFIRTILLCQDVPSPPAGVDAALKDPPPGVVLTRREQLTAHMTEPSCSGCHGLIDPLGFAFEHFDAIGRYREKDRGRDLDTTGDLDGAPFTDAKSLSQRLRESADLESCFVRSFYRYATGHAEAQSEERVLAALTDGFRDRSHRLLELVNALVESDGFRYAAAR